MGTSRREFLLGLGLLPLCAAADRVWGRLRASQELAARRLRPAADGGSAGRCPHCGGRDHGQLDGRCPELTRTAAVRQAAAWRATAGPRGGGQGAA